MLWDSHQVYQTADAKNYEAYIPTEKSTKSFEELQKINPDVIGWIRVNDTNINYPLVQTDNDDTYMNTDAEGNYSLSGAIFLHCCIPRSRSEQVFPVYRHHLRCRILCASRPGPGKRAYAAHEWRRARCLMRSASSISSTTVIPSAWARA